MNGPAKDDNGAPVIYGVSHRDGVTPVQIKFTTPNRMLMDPVTTILFDPSINASMTENDVPMARATSSADNKTVRPWVVNEDTGAVLVDMT